MQMKATWYNTTDNRNKIFGCIKPGKKQLKGNIKMPEKKTLISPLLVNHRNFALIIIGIFLIVSATTILQFYSHIKSATEMHLKQDSTTAYIVSIILEEHLQKIIKTMESYSNRPLLVQAVRSKNIEEIKKHLISLINNHTGIDGMVITDQKGAFLTSFPYFPERKGKNYAYRDWYKGVSRNWAPYVSDVVVRTAAEKDIAINIAVPIFDEKGYVLGIMFNTQQIVVLSRIIKRVPIDPGLSVSITDRKGKLIFSNSYTFDKEITAYPFYPAINKAKGEKRQSIVIKETSGLGKQYIYFYDIANTGWTVIVGRHSHSIFFSDMQHFIYMILTAFFFFLLIILLLLFFRKAIMAKQSLEQLKVLRELEMQEIKFSELFSTISSCVAVYETADNGDNFIFKDLNKAAEETEKVRREDIIGKTVTEVFPGVVEFGLLDVFRKVWKTGKEEHFPEAIYHNAHDSGTWRENWVYKLPSGEIVAVYNDITERKMAEQELLLNAMRQKTLLQLYQMEEGSLDKITTFVVEECLKISGSEIAFIGYINEEGTIMHTHLWSKKAMDMCAVDGKPAEFPIEQGGLWAEAVRQKKPIIVNNFQEPNPYKKGYPEEHLPLKRFMSVPLIEKNHVLVVAGLSNKEEPYSKSDVENITLLLEGMWNHIQRIKAEEESRASAKREKEERQKFITLSENAPFGMLLIDVNNKFIYINQSFKDIFGYDLSEIPNGRAWFEKIYPDPEYRHIVVSRWLEAIKYSKPGKIRRDVLTITCKDGTKKIINFLPVQLDTGEIIMSCEDITEHRRISQLIEESRTILRSLIDAVGETLLMIDKEGEILVINQKGSQRLGKSIKDLIGAGFYDCFNPQTAARIKEGINKAFQTGKDVFLEDVELDRIYETHIYPVLDDGKGAARAVIFSTDITAHRQMEQNLKESEEKYRSIFENTIEGIFQSTPEGRYLSTNTALAHMYGFETPEEMINNISDIAHELYVDPEKRTWVKKEVEEKGFIKNFEVERYRKDKTKFWASMNVRSVRDENGKIYYEGTAEDVTRRIEAEERIQQILLQLEEKNKELQNAYEELKGSQAKIIQSEKMASIGQLAAGVAHEINNPTGFVISNLYSLLKYIERLNEFYNTQEKVLEEFIQSDTKHQEIILERIKTSKGSLKIDYIREDSVNLIRESIDGAERVKKIVQDLKSFSHVDDKAFIMADIRNILDTTLNIVWNELKYKANLKKEYGEVPLTICNPGQIGQVFMNLLVNAAQALENYGEITIRTWHDKTHIYVSISDSGCGISEEHKKRLFEPFFTTKEIGKGTGLGLSISYDIIRKHNGEILVASKKGKGTIFTVKIPIQEGLVGGSENNDIAGRR